MFALGEELDEVKSFKAVEMDAGGGWADLRDQSQLGAGAGVAVHEGVEHARARWLADGGCDPGDGFFARGFFAGFWAHK